MEKYNEMNNQQLEQVNGGAVAADIRELDVREIIAMRKENDLNQLAMIRRRIRYPERKQLAPGLSGSPVVMTASQTGALQ